MIEVIYKEEKQEAQENEGMFTIPRNIRQIGSIREDYKIYMEDYVYTFLSRLSRAENENGEQTARMAVLTGETKWQSGTTYLFVKGALITEGPETALDHIEFTDEMWDKIHEDQKNFFEEQEIVGWFFSQPMMPMETSGLLEKVHLKYFAGEKVLMLMEPQEKEDAFFRYENGFMIRQSGYYLYYEKNLPMQTYMTDKNDKLQPVLTESYADEAVKSFRSIIRSKKKSGAQNEGNQEEAEEQTPVFSYAAAACLAIAVLVVGVNFYNGYQDVRKIPEPSQEVTSVIVEEPSPLPQKEETMTDRFQEDDSLETSRQNGKSSEEEDKGDTESYKTEEIKSESDLKDKKPEEEIITEEDKTDSKKTGQENRNADETEESSASTVLEEDAGTDPYQEIYKEEADVRKAQRRAALEMEEQETASDAIRESYVIKPGDTLFQISMEHYGSAEAVSKICELNGLAVNEIIYPGEVIVLP